MRRKSMPLLLSCIALVALLMPGSLRAGTLFQPAQSYRSGGLAAVSIAVGDVNGDGKPDLVVANLCISTNNCHGGVGVLLGNGDGTFQTVKIFDSGLVFAASVAVADVNADGKLDVVFSSGASCSPPCVGLISVLLGNGDGTFGAPQTYPSGGFQARSIATADVNGDGKLDLLVANGSVNPDLTGLGAVGVLLGNGDGTFGAPQSYNSGGQILLSLAVGDVNGDGKLDLLALHQYALVGVLLGNGDGTFQAAQTYGSGGVVAGSIAVADVNGDGKPDLLVANGGVFDSAKAAVGVLLGSGDGTFQAAQNYSTGASSAVSVAVADVNGDGNSDLLVAHRCTGFCNSSPVAVLLGNGDGTFKAPLRYYSGGRNAYSIAVTDVNGDSKPDLLVANACVSYEDCTSGSVGVLLGNAGVKTTTSLSSNLNPSVYGQAVTLTATVTSVGPSTPTGTVRFQNGTTGLGYATLLGGVATLTKTTLPAGILSITATYNGDPESAKSKSAPLSQTVKQASTTTTIESSLNPSTQGQAVMFTAKVTSPTAHVTGAVTFTAGSAILGMAAVIGGKASLITSTLPKGSNEKITGTYSGTANIAGSAASLFQTVN